MASTVQPSRFLDGAILSLFVMVLAAMSLYLFGEFWGVCIDERLNNWKIGLVMQKLFPFKRTFDFNLTHTLLFSICILLLSIRPELPVEMEQEPSRGKKGKRSKKHGHIEELESPQDSAQEDRKAR